MQKFRYEFSCQNKSGDSERIFILKRTGGLAYSEKNPDRDEELGESIYQLRLLNRAGFSSQLLDVLKEYFRFDEMPDTDAEKAGARTDKYRIAYRISGSIN